MVFLVLFLRCLIDCRDDHKYNIEAVDCLIRSGLVNMMQYDTFLVQLMENGLNFMAITFAMQLVQRYCVDEKHNSQITEVSVQVNSSLILDKRNTQVSFFFFFSIKNTCCGYLHIGRASVRCFQ